ncbi:hypothetical protein ACJIZ3_007380 [Penstemon smallii]|uniref:E3 ubiquitin-protein ligase RMA n=1 Tax=Penstemon smallii TaxID=265156 RepID=A0ABD3SAE2_9LAMI
MDQYQSEFYEDDASLQNWNSLNSTKEVTETNSSGGFECNICLDLVQDPVVTFCGHLYCWPCIYRWINSQEVYPENPDPPQPQCPVCKADVSQKTLIPLYGRGQNSSKDTASDLGLVIPQRPSSPRCGGDTLVPNMTGNPSYNRSYVGPNQYGNYMDPPRVRLGGSSSSMVDPMIGMLGEMVYSRMFGNSDTSLYTYPSSYRLASSSSPRLRRQMRQADKSLSRICFFLCCCVMLCLLLF